MFQVNIHDAKTRFSKVLSRVQAGEVVVIAKNGRPVAKLVPFSPRRGPNRKLGTAKGLVRLSAGWEAPLIKEVLGSFES